MFSFISTAAWLQHILTQLLWGWTGLLKYILLTIEMLYFAKKELLLSVYCKFILMCLYIKHKWLDLIFVHFIEDKMTRFYVCVCTNVLLNMVNFNFHSNIKFTFFYVTLSQCLSLIFIIFIIVLKAKSHCNSYRIEGA